MDLIHLLEILSPAKNVLTVKVDNAKSTFDTISQLLVAASPVAVGLLAMWLSHRQFNKNLSQQSSQFNLSIKNQLSALRLNTRLVTEIELKKETCKEVRSACVDFLEHAYAFYTNKYLYNSYQKISLENREANHRQLIDDAFNASVEFGVKLSSSRCYLGTFLDLDKDKDFINKINHVFDIANSDYSSELPKKFGDARRQCLDMCRLYISSIHQEVINLSENLESNS
ncbi:hypothetical protein [Enterobacter sp. NFIX59]|uniref:hypothetical protein n=1 Tax=Enterobacter sp. NFIX59 TaxID=1566258 RepID=UPI0008E2F114|nr:hypothetical protein [Enterobacter sp. NFIX59]SFJ15399.1 hypothetical protein SAMN03159336_0184 [Enterobacter sp. NFIX59]